MTDQDQAIAALSESLPPEAVAEVMEVVDRAKQESIIQQFRSNLGTNYSVAETQPDRWEIRHLASETLLFASLHCVGDRWRLNPHPMLDRAIKANLKVALDSAIASQNSQDS